MADAKRPAAKKPPKAQYPLAPDASRAKLEIANNQTFAWYMNLLV
jgi:hypothetical protein